MSLYQMRNSNVQTRVANLVPQQTSFNNAPVTGVLSLSGGDATGLSVSNVAGPVKIIQQSGANSKRQGSIQGTNGGVFPILNVQLTLNSMILLSPATIVGANGGTAAITTIGANTFTVTCGAADRSLYNWMVIDTA